MNSRTLKPLAVVVVLHHQPECAQRTSLLCKYQIISHGIILGKWEGEWCLGIHFGSTVAVRRCKLKEFVANQEDFAADMQKSRGFDHSHQVGMQMHRFCMYEAFVAIINQTIGARVAVQPHRSELFRINRDLPFPTSQSRRGSGFKVFNLSV